MDDRSVVRRGPGGGESAVRGAHGRREHRDRAIVRRSEKDLVGLCDEVRRGGITRRQFIERALVLGLSATAVGALAGACGGEGPEPAPPTPGIDAMDETKPDEIVFFNWTDYLAPEVRRRFKAETGIKVREVYYGMGEEILAKLRAGAKGYDVMVPSDYMAHIMIASGLYEPLDMSYLPNFRYVGEAFRTPVYDDPSEHDGLRYTTPYFWGTTGYCQRLDKAPQPRTSWDALWDPSNEGKINLLDDERECLGMALKRRGHSVNTLEQAELDEATADLIEQKPLVATYDSVNMKRAMVEGQAFVMCWDGDVLSALRALGDDEQAKSQLSWVLPEEGFARWTDALAVPVGRNSRYGAHQWIDFLMRPDIAGRNASWVKYLSPIAPASWEFTDPFALTLKPSDEELARSEQITDVGEFATAYGEAWRQVKSA
jgi:spermidine/putrescine transport system substrate-binding protein